MALSPACTEVCDTDEGTWEDSQGDNMAFKGLTSTLTSGPSLTTGDALPPLGTATGSR